MATDSHAASRVTLTTLRAGAAALGLGMGIANTPLVIAVQTSVGFSQRGVATASTMFFRNIGGTVAVGAMGAILARALVQHSADAARGTELVARILSTARTGTEADADLLAAVARDLSIGLTRVMALVAALAIAAARVAWLFPDVPDPPHRRNCGSLT